jgi:hypothetical protein
VSTVTFQNVVVRYSDYAFQNQKCYKKDTNHCTEHLSTAQLSRVGSRGPL